MNRKNHLKKINSMFAAAAAFALLVTGCSLNSTSESSQTQDSEISSQETENSTVSEQKTTEMTASLSENSSAEASSVVSIVPENVPFTTDITNLFTERDLRTDYEVTSFISLDEITDSVLEITQEGVYELSGTFNGQVHVNTDGKVQIVLNNAQINNTFGAAIYVENAKKVFLTLADNSQNTVSDGSSYTDISTTAAIYSADDITINGTGSLTVNGNFQEGITSKDDLTIAGGNITVNAVTIGIKGKDSISVYDGTIQITAGADGLKSSNDTDEGKGFIYIQNGGFSIEAQQDGIQAETELIITGGTFTVISDGGTANAPQKNNDFGGFGGFDPNQSENTDTETETSSSKGLKAGSVLYLSDGEFVIDTAENALHSKGSVWIAGGMATFNAGNKGIHAGETVTVSDGTVNIAQSYEGVEAASILISGGTVLLNASDDGFNASDGSDQGARGDAVNASLEISGGYVYVNADGDGLDSNGKMIISGGTVLVDGPVNDGNGALDSNNGITVSGGFLLAVGSSGMAEYPDDASQNVIFITLDSYQEANTLVTLCDADGKEVLSFAPAKKFNSVVFSSDALETGKTYTLYLNGSSTSEQQNGLYTNGSYQNDGTESGSVTLEGSVSFIGEAKTMGMPGGGGMMNGHGGGMRGRQFPEDMPQDFDPSQMHGNHGEMPDDMNPPDANI
ncbi:MAG: carbohydrate-binding domain-containing protein [Oscillospiraceae bacterium]|nr:carbohydrate-binding domain-containing protein [Oscillospiraceae bacterium]